MIGTLTFEKAHLAFSKALKKLRADKNISQGDLFLRTGLERAYISKLENGKINDPRLTTVVVLAKALGVPIDEFVKEMEEIAKQEEAKDRRLSKKK